MANSIQSIRGMHDFLPGELSEMQHFESVARSVMHQYGYQEIRTPIVESTELFARSIGEVTDIVEKEMYTFEDRNGDMLTLRPEGTASCVRAGIQHGFLHNQVRRLWYSGAMFRHERPQKGRYRQFHQLGVEAFGFADPDIDVELILMGSRLWKELGLKEIRLEINTLGNTETRASYRKVLVEYLKSNKSILDNDSIRRLELNPMRVLDSKNPDMQEMINAAPSLHDYLDDESMQHFKELKTLLKSCGIEYTINTRLVRGLDYYCRTVFEWVSDKLGAQGTVCAGGRYDGLVKQLGGRGTPAAGFAVGTERIVSLMKDSENDSDGEHVDVYMVICGNQAEAEGLSIAEELRKSGANLAVVANCGGGSLKSQLKRADRSGALCAVILGETEIKSGVALIKSLRDDRDQVTVPIKELGQKIDEFIQIN